MSKKDRKQKVICQSCGLPGEHTDASECIKALKSQSKTLKKKIEKYKNKDKLNDLSPSEWLYASSTWWETNYKKDPSHKLRSRLGAVKPPQVGADLTKIFTTQGQIVVDTFAGTGGLMLGADLVGRIALGCEINPEMISVIKEINDQFGIKDGEIVNKQHADTALEVNIDCADCIDWLRSLSHASVDFVMTDPPYGVQHKKKSNEGSFALDVLEPENGWGRLETLKDFLQSMREWALEVRRVLRNGRYVAVFMSDRYRNSEYIHLGSMVSDALASSGLVPKSKRIWRNKATEGSLFPYGGGNVYVPNIRHQYVLIHRKED